MPRDSKDILINNVAEEFIEHIRICQPTKDNYDQQTIDTRVTPQVICIYLMKTNEESQ